MFGDNPQSSFASVGFGAFDGAVRPYSEPSSIFSQICSHQFSTEKNKENNTIYLKDRGACVRIISWGLQWGSLIIIGEHNL